MQAQTTSTISHPEFQSLINEVTKKTLKEIQDKAFDIESAMPYKFQYVLEEVIKQLQSWV